MKLTLFAISSMFILIVSGCVGNLTESQITQITKVGNSVSFQEIDLDKDWRLSQSFDYSTYKGIFRDENELKKVWAYMVNAWDEHYGTKNKNENQPVMPDIDFNKYSVIWYANRGGSASFVNLNNVLENNDILLVNITRYHDDYGSSGLNLWIISKTEKRVYFVEDDTYISGG